MPSAEPRRRVVLLRHGETAHNAARRWQGRLDTELTALGLAQAEAAAPLVAAYRPDLLVSSPLQRARLTAEPVSRLTGLAVHLDDDLAEIDVGQWQGLDAAAIEAREPGYLGRIEAGDDLPRGVTGETFADVMVRAGGAVERWTERLPQGGTLVVATHGVAARAVVGRLTALGRSTWFGLGGLRNCTWALLGEVPVEAGHGWRLMGWSLGAERPSQGPDLGRR